jgi:hypothetical protein
MDLIKVIDLPPLKIEELNSLVTDLAPKYRKMMIDDIVSMTHIQDSTSIKNPVVCIQKNKDLRKQYFCDNSFNQICEEVLKITI